MNTHPFLILLLLAWGSPALSEEKQDGHQAPRGVLPEKNALSASKNLDLPEGLPAKTRQDMEKAISQYLEAETAKDDRSRRLSKALEKLRMVSLKAYKEPLPLFYLGRGYQFQHEFDRAKKSLEKAVKLNPRFHEALVELGDVHVWQKDYRGALGVYEKALEVKSDYVPAIDNKARALIQMGRFKEAKVYLDQAQKMKPVKARKSLTKKLVEEIEGPDWKKTYTKETKHFEVFTSVSQDYADEISRHAELIHRAYDKVFSEIKKPDRIFPIWVYKDRQAYVKAGGPAFAAGHYDPRFRKLVLFRTGDREGTIRTLYHEAFHQFIHDYLEEAPQWFNEGMADYFGSFQYHRQRSKEWMIPRPNPGRLGYVKNAIQQRLCPPASELMVMSHQEMYNPRMIGVHYSQAWSMIYFMLESKHTGYKKLLINYFKLLDRGKSILDAYKSTFGRIDMEEFDRKWQGYIKNLSGK